MHCFAYTKNRHFLVFGPFLKKRLPGEKGKTKHGTSYLLVIMNIMSEEFNSNDL